MTFGNLNFLPYNSCDSNELKLINSNDRYFTNDESNYNQQDVNINDLNERKSINLCDHDLELKLTNLTD